MDVPVPLVLSVPLASCAPCEPFDTSGTFAVAPMSIPPNAPALLYWIEPDTPPGEPPPPDPHGDPVSPSVFEEAQSTQFPVAGVPLIPAAPNEW